MNIIKIDIPLQPYETLLALLWQLSKQRERQLGIVDAELESAIDKVKEELTARFGPRKTKEEA